MQDHYRKPYCTAKLCGWLIILIKKINILNNKKLKRIINNHNEIIIKKEKNIIYHLK